MNIQPIQNVNFGIYQNTTKTVRSYGTVMCDTGLFKDKKIEIYSMSNKEGQLEHKLYYVSQMIKWLKSKLVYFSNGKKWKVLRSENRR
jgi:hypothetical protein